jgi:hypothetical protein
MQRYFFLHIPKTAGTSFRHLLRIHFRQRETYPSQRLIRQRGGYPLLKEAEAFFQEPGQAARIRLLLGHYPLLARDFLPERPHCMTFLRDPVERSISELYHHYTKNEHEQGRSLEEIFQRRKRSMHNSQCRMLYQDRPELLRQTPFPMTEPAFQQVKANLQQCEFVGIAERFSDSVSLLRRTFGWGWNLPLRLNQRAKSQLPPVSEALRKEIEQANAWDLELYEFASALFSKRLAASKKR